MIKLSLGDSLTIKENDMKRILQLSALLLIVASAQAVDFDTQIQPIFNTNCTGCHGNSAGLSLAAGSSFDNLVDIASTNYAPALRVVSGDPSTSVLYNKVANTGVNGGVMPQGGSLTTEQIALISTWITELAAVTPITIAEARATAEEEIVTIQGIVTSVNFAEEGGSEYAIQDPTGGIVAFSWDFDAGLLIGDAVTITGEIDFYNGKSEIVPETPQDVIIESSGNSLPEFQVLTIAEILADGEAYDSELGRIDSVTIISGTWPSAGSNANLTITDPSGETLTMRIDKETEIDENDPLLGYFNVQGVIGQFDSSEPYDEGYQILPRLYTDFVQIGDPAPAISAIMHTPASPTPADDVIVTATIIDNSAVASASLGYVVDDGIEMVVEMTAGENNEYTGVIPAQAGDALVSYTVSAADDLGGTSTSEPSSYVVYGETINSIASIQDGTVPTGTLVIVEGIVTAEPFAFHDEDNLSYYFIQDDFAAQSGIKVYDPGRRLAEGDEIRLTGTVAESSGMTEIADIDSIEVLSHGNTMNPLLITLDATMEMYEGCLVEINDVTVLNPDMGLGYWRVSDGTNEFIIDDAADYFYTPVLGEALSSIVGVLDYSQANYRIQPRLARDIQTADGLTRIQAIQQVRYSDLLPRYSPIDSSVFFADTSYYNEEWTDTMIVTVQGVVTMPTGITYAGDGIKFILQDVNGGPWSSILSYNPDSTAYPVLFEGDLIEMSGRILEFDTRDGSSVSNMTELWITTEIDILNFGLPLPEEPVISTGDLRWPTTAEQWGNVMVKVQNATIIENLPPDDFDMLRIDDGSGSVLVDDDSRYFRDWTQEYPGDPVYIQPLAGSVYDEARGWVYHHYGSYEDSTTYKLVPLYQSDMVLNTSAIDNLVVPEGYALGNYPNPFNPTTNIAFRIPEALEVQLVIYNQLGQHVTTLVDQSLNAGEYQVVWNGLTEKGRPVSSGLYFYRMIAGSEQMVGKMTYLK
ncbi:MAG: T9SS type A sorting domain-containing protein [Candidatus Marinimicrobia bacterium]|jgi:DNA/RNA endonuclease YhcR with UshA esterase domain|nr:T9SS type A sorting domain-containing protein [Candidatus Neomarinimicrobiota bacterium]MBT4361275.1 T9SS type A sorting domain-containing protein [Candidatus Neomarinimicrobiota bacterium]MBT4715280.1 T9SS type A sorting domain-containing protein [Candidatus Neomarinimicrobiota bacterium]MBT4946283.1 T9SS type A sorting domain-containing protein [Candidatus Neomarinimicrobiota bacterium]MBT6009968.1 T9SS type A sorting domain-containing protein [Candidatus Neomarinimicrobiota bacterium]